jgi:hypothetical protein
MDEGKQQSGEDQGQGARSDREDRGERPRSDDARDPRNLTESDLAQDIRGRNSLQGEDQESVRNQRQAYPDERLETDDIVESLEKLDKDVRAERDLGKGNK